MAWRPLQVSAHAGAHLPVLLISTKFTSEAYTIQLTDLTHLWSESLDRKGIIWRSGEEATSIDPSDGGQFKIFIEKIKSGLEGSNNTTLALTINSDADRPSLTLNISVSLPGGLAPLAWPVRLAASPPFQLTSQLIVPLLRAQHVHMQEISGLVEALKEKDHVIQKLLDKMESQGTELSEIFPQAAGRPGRKVDRKQAVERVRGLGVFDMEGWRKRLDIAESRDTSDLIEQVFTGETTDTGPADKDLVIGEEQDNWWDSIKGITMNLGTGRISTNGVGRNAKPSARPVAKKQDSVDEDDDAFQVMSTPPHLSKSAKIRALQEDDSTDDEDDLDAPSQRSKIPDSYPQSALPPPLSPPKPKKSLGKIGGMKMVARPKSPVHENVSTEDEDGPVHKPSAAPKANKQNVVVDGDEGSTEDEPSPAKANLKKKVISPIPKPTPRKPVKKLAKIGSKKEASPPSPEPESEPERESTPPTAAAEEPKPKKGKLGKIGGKKKIVRPEPEPELEPAASDQSHTKSEIASPPEKSKLGKIGAPKSLAAKDDEDVSMKVVKESPGRGRASTRPAKEVTPELRETSEERKKRRREQLDRELEAAAKKPVKKKRKF